MQYSYCHLWPARLYIIIPHLTNGMIFEEKKSYWSWNVSFVFPTYFFSETFLILRRNERDKIHNVYWSSCKVPVFLVWYQRNFNTFFKNTQISNLTKIRPVGGEMFHAGGRKDRHDEANSRFSQFCERA